MVENGDVSPLVMAAEQHATIGKYAGVLLETFAFHSQRRHDPLLAAIETLKLLYTEGRRVLPDRSGPFLLFGCHTASASWATAGWFSRARRMS